MVKIKGAKSKRVSSKQRHKIERKKREHKRDLRKAAKELKKNGQGPHRSKKSRDLARLALKVSNVHPRKEEILRRVLQARENARVEKATRRKRHDTEEEVTEEGGPTATPRASNRRQLLYIPVKDSNNFRVQFERALEELVFPDGSAEEGNVELPCVAYVVTLDSRFAVQSIPWTLIDAVMEQAGRYRGGRKVLLLFTLTKTDLVSAPALLSQVALVCHALNNRYEKGSFGGNVLAAITPFSVQHEKSGRHLLRILHQFRQSDGCVKTTAESNMENKVCAFVIGLPNTGRRTLCRTLASAVNESSVSTVPLRAAQMQLIKSSVTGEEEADDGNDGVQAVRTRFAIPNAKAVTLVQFPEDSGMQKELRNVTGGDVFFRSPAFIEKTLEPEPIGCVLFEAFVDKVALAQAFCQSVVSVSEGDEGAALRGAEKFLRDLGRTVRRDKGFFVSPLFASNAGTMGKLTSSSLTAHAGFTSGQQSNASNLLDSTYSNASPSKLVRISSVVTKARRSSHKLAARADARNALRLGARTFIRELCQAKNVPWAVMRAPGMATVTPKSVAAAAANVFDVSLTEGKKRTAAATMKPQEHLAAIVDHFAALLKDFAAFLPNGVVEMDPDAIVPPQYSLEEPEQSNEEEDGSSAGSEEEEEDGEAEADDEEDDDANESEDDEDEEA